VTLSMAELADELEAQAQRLRAAEALGRSATTIRLFEYLLQRSKEGDAPKEIEVADAVFGRRVSFDIAQDSTVRVNVHRLRKKLEDYYAGPGRDEPTRLTIPKGEYRIVAASYSAEEEGAERSKWIPGWLARLSTAPVVAGLIALLVVALIGDVILVIQDRAGNFGYARSSPAWHEMIKTSRPITLVVGDYFIFGELDDHGEGKRLIREYDINSSDDLSNYMMSHPDTLYKYQDLDLHYLPVSTAFALRSIMPVLAPDPSEREQIRVVTASALTPDMIKRNDIVYVGYFSGLGLLREPVFAASRYRIGETWDQLVDQKTQKIYDSQEGGPETSAETRRDYGYFSTFTGPNGNRIIIIAGARDVGVMQTAEAVSSQDGIADLKKAAGHNTAFETLYEVEGMNRVNLRGRIVKLSPIDPSKAWDGRTNAPQFPKS
jgi:hypothetical protein